MNPKFSNVFSRAVGVSMRSGFLRNQCRTATVSTSSIPSEQIITHGKYRGLSFNDCRTDHPEYCEWLKKRADKLVNDERQREFVHYLLSHDQGGKHDDSSTPVLANTSFPPSESGKHVRVNSSNFADTLQVENRTSSDVPDVAKDERASPINENTVISFGKHQGEKFGDIIANDPQYCQWFLKQAGAKKDTGEVYEPSDFELYLKRNSVEKAASRRVFPKNAQQSGSLGAPPGAPLGASSDVPDVAKDEQAATIDENTIMSYGKHKGERFGDIIANDPKYCQWFVKQADAKKDTGEAYEPSEFKLYLKRESVEKAASRRVFPKNIEQSGSLDSGDWIVTFGAKWKDRTYREVWEADPGYCKWMAKQIASSEKASKEVLSFIVYVQRRMLDHLKQDLNHAKT